MLHSLPVHVAASVGVGNRVEWRTATTPEYKYINRNSVIGVQHHPPSDGPDEQGLRNMVYRTLNSHRTVLNHGDLQPKNIMVERLGDRDGYPEFRIPLLDWESAAWYPEFWDFCNATIACRFKPDWLEIMSDILDQYPVEFLIMQVVYSSVFY